MLKINRPAIATLAIAAALAACKGGGNNQTAYNTDTTKAAAARVDTAGTPANPSAAAANDSAKNANNGWSPATITAYTTAADQGEVQLGRLAEKKATNPQVKAFAREMVSDHEKLLAADKKLAAKTKAVPDTTNGDVKDLMNHARDEVKDLTDKAAGADWDKNYMDKAIDDHKNVLGKLQDAAKNTTDPDAKKALEAATGKVQEHLTKAQDIRSKLK